MSEIAERVLALPEVQAVRSPRHRQFVLQTLADRSLNQALWRAGYKTRRPGEAVKRIFERTPEVRAAIKAAWALQDTILAEQAAPPPIVTREWWLQTARTNVERALQAEPVVDSRGNPTGEYRYAGGVVNGGLRLIGEHMRYVGAKAEGEQGPRYVFNIAGGPTGAEVHVHEHHHHALARPGALALPEAEVV